MYKVAALAILMQDCVKGVGCAMFGYGAIIAGSCAVLTSSEPVALGLDHQFLSKDFGPDKDVLDGFVLLNVTIISLLVNSLVALDLSGIGQCFEIISFSGDCMALMPS